VIPDVMTINNIIGEDITYHFLHNVMEVNNTKIKITRPDTNLIINKMRNKVTIVKAGTKVDHQAEACNLTLGRLEMIKAVTEHFKEYKEP